MSELIRQNIQAEKESGSKNRYAGRNTETLPEQIGIKLGMPEPC